MIIGTITLISMLFFSGALSLFLVEDFDKGVEKYVVEKERRKELLADLKDIKKTLKDMNEERDDYIKTLKKLNTNRNTTTADFMEYQDKLLVQAVKIQDLTIDSRLQLIKKITQEEWDQIMALSAATVQKTKDKLEAKREKGKVKDPFQKFESEIEKTVSNPENKEKILSTLETYKKDLNILNEKIASRNVIDNPTFKNKEASRDDLKKIADEVNAIKVKAFEAMVDFHFTIKEQTTEKEWDKIVKAFNKTW